MPKPIPFNAEFKTTEEYLQYRIEIEKVISSIAVLLNGSHSEEKDKIISQALEKVGKVARADRSYLFILKDNGLTMDNTHEWCASGITPERDNLQDLKVADFKFFINGLKQNQIVHILNVDDLPDEEGDFKQFLSIQGIHSILNIPINLNSNLYGFIGLDSVHKQSRWNHDDISLLRTLGEIFSGFLNEKPTKKISAINKITILEFSRPLCLVYTFLI
ncbi:MAG: GAF domain-containing protein [Gammaproteobacteria bacterium]|nr:GAF domain-containing protein [Gammaproteobacteria bacterium]